MWCVLLLLMTFSGTSASQEAVLHKLDLRKYPLATCIDGTPGAFYTASGAAGRRWYVHHSGGGWCAMDVPDSQGSTVDSCHHRRNTSLGSSNPYAPKTVLGGAGGYISDDQAQNPLMHDWNKVQMIYCDGGSFSGRNETLTLVDGVSLYFRGNYILEAVIDTLKTEYGLANASDVVVSGGSAGGLATYLHADKWRASLPASTFVVGMPDGGFFLDWDESKPATSRHSYAKEMRKNFFDFNASAGVNAACITAFTAAGGDSSACYFAEHTIDFIKAPIFALQSYVDSWQLGNELGSDSASQINMYREAAMSRLQARFAMRSDRGGFFDSCQHHCGLWDQLLIDGIRMADAFTTWYEAQRAAWETGTLVAGKRIWSQEEAAPCHECCGGHTVSSYGESMYSFPLLGAEVAVNV